MANVDAQNATLAGITPTFSAVTASDALECGDDVLLYVKNGNAASCTVTLVTPGTVGGLAVADSAVVIPAGQDRIIGPIDIALFRDNANNRATVTYSVTSSVTAALIRA